MTERKRVVACLLLYVWAVSVPDIAAAIGYRNAADRSQLERVVAELLELRAEVEELKSAAAKQNNRTPKSADERDDNTVSNRESTSNEQQLREATRGEMGSIGTTYVRWGRTLCENSAQVVYRVLRASSATIGSEDNSVLKQLAELQEKVKRLEALTDGPKQTGRSQSADHHGVTYIRWGRTTCEGNAIVVYRGYAAGGHYAQDGGGSNLVCLHERPKWNKYIPGVADGAGNIYGVEYKLYNLNDVFSKENNDGHIQDLSPAPCVACYVANRSAQLMIPATTECPFGWTKEYRGYLMSEASATGHRRGSYNCWDEAPETAIGGKHQTQALAYTVHARCGSLPCSKFHDGYEVSCVVCTI